MGKFEAIFCWGGEDHPLALLAHEDGGLEVGNDDDLFADEKGEVCDLFADAGEDGSLLKAEVDGEFEHFFAFGDALDVGDFGDAEVEFAHVVDGDLLF